MQHRNTQTEFELETTANRRSMHQFRRPIPLHGDRGTKSQHLAFTVTTQVTYAGLVATSWFCFFMSLHV
jgi:hypothetical protein